MKRAALLLAAGISRRFGAADKLLAPIAGRPMVGHVAEALAALPLSFRIAVVSSPDVARLLALHGFETMMISPGGPMSDSLRAGITVVKRRRASSALVALGDMPFLTTDDFARFLAGSENQLLCASCQGVNMPPALFPASRYEELIRLSQDRGASAMLADLAEENKIAFSASKTKDIDTLPDFTSASSS